MKILVVGAGGQVGEKIGVFAQRSSHYTIGAYKSKKPASGFNEIFQLDKTNKSETRSTISKFKPDVVVDTAALHNVDYCEIHPVEAFTINRDGTSNLAVATSEINSKFIFISTDFVFDGRFAPYTEDSLPNPESVYARSKLEGEKAALSVNENSVVCRPAVIYSWVDWSNIKFVFWEAA